MTCRSAGEKMHSLTGRSQVGRRAGAVSGGCWAVLGAWRGDVGVVLAAARQGQTL